LLLLNAGIGNDPREDRKFNMIKQSMDYDPNGDYIRLWVTELKEIPSPQIHAPWLLSFGALSAAKVKLGESYPNPIVVAPEWTRHVKGNRKVCIWFSYEKYRAKMLHHFLYIFLGWQYQLWAVEIRRTTRCRFLFQKVF
jgi:hypothetical protein